MHSRLRRLSFSLPAVSFRLQLCHSLFPHLHIRSARLPASRSFAYGVRRPVSCLRLRPFFPIRHAVRLAGPFLSLRQEQCSALPAPRLQHLHRQFVLFPAVRAYVRIFFRHDPAPFFLYYTDHPDVRQSAFGQSANPPHLSRHTLSSAYAYAHTFRMSISDSFHAVATKVRIHFFFSSPASPLIYISSTPTSSLASWHYYTNACSHCQ